MTRHQHPARKPFRFEAIYGYVREDGEVDTEVLRPRETDLGMAQFLRALRERDHHRFWHTVVVEWPMDVRDAHDDQPFVDEVERLPAPEWLIQFDRREAGA